MKAVLAISGGIDSMVMLDIFAREEAKENTQEDEELQNYHSGNPKVAVAIFNHGTRPSAEDDVAFVQKMAGEKYEDLPCYTAKSNLGENAPEAIAREKRYEFLRELAAEMSKSENDKNQKKVMVYTAHHLDDLVESVAINLLRGTGWRGLAVLDAPGIARPLLEADLMPRDLRDLVPFDKNAIRKYAARNEISFRQDPTNCEDNYLRNRVREKLGDFDEKRKIYDLWRKQKKLKREIDELVQELLPAENEPWQRSWFEDLAKAVALELLRAGTRRVGVAATRPQLEDFWQAIRSYAPGKSFNLPQDHLVKFTKETFWL